MRLLTTDAHLQTIMEEQFFLSSKAGISLMDSNNIPDFERTIYVGLLMKELMEKKQALENL
jgi:hypothetical protein